MSVQVQASNVATLSVQKAVEGLLDDSSSSISEYKSRGNMFGKSKRYAVGDIIEPLVEEERFAET